MKGKGNKELIDKLKKILGRNVSIYPENIYPEKTKGLNLTRLYSGPLFCIHCGSDKIYEFYKNTGGTIAGGSTDEVFF